MQTLTMAQWHSTILLSVEQQRRAVLQRRQERVEIRAKQTLLRGANIARNCMLHVADPRAGKIIRYGEMAQERPEDREHKMHQMRERRPCEHQAVARRFEQLFSYREAW